MLLCDDCNAGYHLHCLDPPLDKVPPGNWFCADCAPKHVINSNETAVQKEQKSAEIDKSQQLHGAKIFRKIRIPESRGFESQWGELVATPDKYPHVLEAHWDDDTVQPVSYKAALRMLYADTLIALVNQKDIWSLPEQWQLSDPLVLHDALQLFMPGHWDSTHITKLSQKMPGGIKFPSGDSGENSPAWVPTLGEEITPLLDCMKFELSHVILDPWSGSGGISETLKSLGHTVVTNDINPEHSAHLHQDALQPGFYQRLLKASPVDVIVLSPWFAYLDIALPSALMTAKLAVCAHVPGHYFTNGVMARFNFLKPYFQSNRVHFVWGLPRGPMGMRCAWLVIFASEAVKHSMLKPDALYTHSISLP